MSRFLRSTPFLLLAVFVGAFILAGVTSIFATGSKRAGEDYRDTMYYTSRAITDVGQVVNMDFWVADVMITNTGATDVFVTTGATPYSEGEGGFANLNFMRVRAGETLILEDFQTPTLAFKAVTGGNDTVYVRAIR